MKFERLVKDNLLIELDEKELITIFDALELSPGAKIFSDIDRIVFSYYRALEKRENIRS